MTELSRRNFLAASAATAGVAALAGTAVASADEAAAEEGPVTAASDPQNGTLDAGYLSYFDWLGTAPALTPADAANTVTADVVVVGGGNSGICGALAAAEAGATVAVVEQQDQEAYTFLGHDIGTVNCQHVIGLGGQEIDEIEFVQDWTKRNMNRSNPGLVRKFAATSGASLDWILSHLTSDIVENAGVFGVPLPTAYPGEISGFKCWSAALHFEPTEGGATDWPDAAKQLEAAAEALGATWHFGQTAQVLVKDGNKVTGVIATDADGNATYYEANKGVIIAAGDYVGNPSMVFGLNDEYRNFVEDRGLDWTQIRGMGRTGDGQKMVCWAGGRMEPGPHASMGRAMGAGAFGGVALPQFNRNGKRFQIDDDFGKDAFLMDPIATPPFYASIVMDSNDFKLGLVELGGVVTDENQQVLDRDDNPIEGLYATGNCCGGRFIAQYHTPIAGISIGWATSMGKLAGETVAAL